MDQDRNDTYDGSMSRTDMNRQVLFGFVLMAGIIYGVITFLP